MRAPVAGAGIGGRRAAWRRGADRLRSAALGRPTHRRRHRPGDPSGGGGPGGGGPTGPGPDPGPSSAESTGVGTMEPPGHGIPAWAVHPEATAAARRLMADRPGRSAWPRSPARRTAPASAAEPPAVAAGAEPRTHPAAPAVRRPAGRRPGSRRARDPADAAPTLPPLQRWHGRPPRPARPVGVTTADRQPRSGPLPVLPAGAPGGDRRVAGRPDRRGGRRSGGRGAGRAVPAVGRSGWCWPLVGIGGRRGPGLLARPGAHRRAVVAPGGPMGVVGRHRRVAGSWPPVRSGGHLATVDPASDAGSGRRSTSRDRRPSDPGRRRSPDRLRRAARWSARRSGATRLGAGAGHGGRRPGPHRHRRAGGAGPQLRPARPARPGRADRGVGPGAVVAWPGRDPTSTGSSGSSPACPTTAAAVRRHWADHAVLGADSPAGRSYRALVDEAAPVTRRHRVWSACPSTPPARPGRSGPSGGGTTGIGCRAGSRGRSRCTGPSTAPTSRSTACSGPAPWPG